MTGEKSAARQPLSYAIREARAEDLPRILALLGSNLSNSGVTAKTEAFWSWKHVEPTAGRSIVYVATAPGTGEIIGLRAVMRFDIVDGKGILIHAVRPVDTVTHPDWQRKGIFSKLTLSLIDGLRDGPITMLFNTPNSNSLPAYLKLGWRVVQEGSLRVRPGNPWKLVRYFRPAADDASWSKVTAGGMRYSIDRFVEILPNDRERLLQACEKYEGRRPRTGRRLQRNARTLAWRYAHPTADYRVLRIQHAGSELPDALAFFRYEMRKGFRGALLTDFFCGPQVSLGQLLSACFRSIRASFYVASASDGTDEDAALAKAFFFPVQKVKLAQRPVDLDGQTNTAQPQVWDLTLADIEIF